MSEMVERVAKAIIKAEDECQNLYMDDVALMYATIARAAIAAMREPTEGMVSAARRLAPYDQDVTETWGPMIDEALK